RVTVTRDLGPGALLDALRQAAPEPVTPDLTALHWVGDHAGCAVSRIDGRPPALLLSASGYGRCAASVRPAEWTDYRLTTDVQGEVDFGSAARGPRPQPLAFLGPRLTDLRPKPPHTQAQPPAPAQG